MRIFIAGTFDHFHVGHQQLVWSAYWEATDLVIIIARDLIVKKIKGSLPFNNENTRLERVKKEFEGFGKVNVQLGDNGGDFLKTLEKVNPTHVFLGYDQHADTKKINHLFPEIKIKRIKPYFSELFKSSKF